AGRLDPRRGRHHVHDHEGGNFAAARGLQQAPGTVSQCRFKHGYLLSDPGLCQKRRSVPRTSLIRRFVRAYRVSRLPPIIYRSLMLRKAPTRKACKAVAIVTAAAMALTPVAAIAQGGLPVLR